MPVVVVVSIVVGKRMMLCLVSFPFGVKREETWGELLHVNPMSLLRNYVPKCILLLYDVVFSETWAPYLHELVVDGKDSLLCLFRGSVTIVAQCEDDVF